MLNKIKRWLVDIAVRLLENRKIRTWTICFALRHAPVAKFLASIGVEEKGE